MAQRSFCGIDVAKDRLDVMVLPEELCWSVANDAAGWVELVARLRSLRIAASGIEASGGYERGVVRALLAAGMSIRQINPFNLRQFAKACGVLAKNDRLDARMIALFVATMPTRSAQQYTAVERLAEIVNARRQLSDDRVAAENASRLFEDAPLRCLYRGRIAPLAADIALLDKRLAEIVAGDAMLARRYALLVSMPGVGPVLAVTLLPAAGTRTDEPQAGRGAGRGCALRLRQRQAQGNALHLAWSCSGAARAVHGGADCLPLQSPTQSLPRPPGGRWKENQGRHRRCHAQDHHHPQCHAS
jgi:transposase